MDLLKWKEFEKIAGWLFEHSGEEWAAQWALARANKTAYRWCPGNLHMMEPPTARDIANAAFVGCSQLAFRDSLTPQTHQPTMICWLGLDIDADDGVDIDLAALVGALPPEASIRSSGGGRGIHVILRLAQPLGPSTLSTATALVKRLGRDLSKPIEAAGIRVCSSDRRMFWLVGGANRWIKHTDALWTPPTAPKLDVVDAPAPTAADAEAVKVDVSDRVARYVTALVGAGALNLPVSLHNLVYVGGVMKVLEAMGERIDSVSGRSGDGKPNGYVDLTRNSIALWTYADGRTVWRFDDVEEMVR